MSSKLHLLSPSEKMGIYFCKLNKIVQDIYINFLFIHIANVKCLASSTDCLCVCVFACSSFHFVFLSCVIFFIAPLRNSRKRYMAQRIETMMNTINKHVIKKIFLPFLLCLKKHLNIPQNGALVHYYYFNLLTLLTSYFLLEINLFWYVHEKKANKKC